MPTQNVLLSLNNVKMHFPLKKNSIFDKERPVVKAVDGVTIDIFEGETFGLVGESGCGKSTLGRVILQLYEQTAGSLHYRGVTLNDYAPAYSFKDAGKITSVKGSPAEIIANYLGTVKLCGALLLHANLPEVAKTMTESLNAVKAVYRLKKEINLLDLKRIAYHESTDLTVVEKKRFSRIERKIASLNEELKILDGRLAASNASLGNLRASQTLKDGYDLLEKARDISVDLSRLTKEEMRRLRRELQVVFQDPYSSLNPRFSVGQLISEALVTHKMFARSTRQLEEYTLNVMEKCGLQNYFLHRYPHQFSGGQRQRIGIARALALKPKFVVCDEAVSALDVSIQSQIINLLMDLKDSQKLTYLFISHDLSAVKFISDRVAVMYLGNIIELADSDRIFAEPLHPYTNVLLEAIPTTDEASKKELQVIEGDIPSPVNPPSGCKFHTRCRYADELCKTNVPEWRELRERHYVACHYPLVK
ncbi:MAG: ATP-binding cassette domain-containing protein [Lachnospiraceae bacterium]|nr:ATP-binding cassette domain-containing protein [Lachnospiraceae bacterium]